MPVSKLVAYSLLATLAAACGKDESKDSDTKFVLDTDAASLSSRVALENTDIALEPVEGANLVGLLPGVETFTAVQVAELTPPTVNGVKVQANDVAFDATGAFVSYNTAGDSYGGAVDQLDLLNVLHLSILSNVSSTTMDMNGIARSGTNIYVVGADSSVPGVPAVLRKFPEVANLLTSTSTSFSLPSYAGTDVTAANGNIYALSGDAGGMTVFTESTMAQTAQVALADARSVAVASDGLVHVLSGQTGRTSVLNSAGNTVSRTMALGGATIAQSKSTIQVGSTWSLASLGDAGAVIYCTATGATIASVPAPTVSGLASTKTVTNAASAYGGLVFTANGEAGVYVYSLRDASGSGSCGAGTLTLLGKLAFPAGFSANGVFYNGLTLFVVDGLGGLKILTATYVNTLGGLSNKL